MGGGRKLSPDVPKGPPRDPLEPLFPGLDETGGVEASPNEPYVFCEQRHVVPFRITAASGSVLPGSTADLVLGDPPYVRIDGEIAGIVDGPVAIAVRGCLELGYRIAGTVESFDAAALTGTLIVEGERRQVA